MKISLYATKTTSAAVLGLALFRLLGKLESGDLSGLADGKLGSQDGAE